MQTWGEAVVERLDRELAMRADRDRAAAMARYMKDRYPFYGVPATQRREAQRAALSGFDAPTEAELTEALRLMWAASPRELQYAGTDLVAANVPRCSSELLTGLHELITTKSWWDTVDTLAAHGVGPLVKADRSLQGVMRAWSDEAELWTARTAILHQLRWGADTDLALLYELCLAHASSPEFFLRKAIGWALREASRHDPTGVRAFVAEHPMSRLTRREALRWLDRRR